MSMIRVKFAYPPKRLDSARGFDGVNNTFYFRTIFLDSKNSFITLEPDFNYASVYKKNSIGASGIFFTLEDMGLLSLARNEYSSIVDVTSGGDIGGSRVVDNFLSISTAKISERKPTTSSRFSLSASSNSLVNIKNQTLKFKWILIPTVSMASLEIPDSKHFTPILYFDSASNTNMTLVDVAFVPVPSRKCAARADTPDDFCPIYPPAS